MTEKAITVCPKDRCQQPKWGKGKVKRAVSAGAGLIFKGSGFYTTDYRSEKYKEAAQKEAPASPPSSEGKSSAPNAESSGTKTAATKS